VGKLTADTLARFERIGVLVNSVGAGKGGTPAHGEDLATWDVLSNVNCFMAATIDTL